MCKNLRGKGNSFKHIIAKLFQFIILRSPSFIYVKLFNVKLKLKKIQAKVKIKDSYFEISELGKVWKFHEKYYGYFAYQNGIKVRGERLGQQYFLNTIEFKQDDVIIDCGAHNGDLLLYFHNHQIQIRYIAIEPLRSHLKLLEYNVFPHAVFNNALWSEDSSLTFYRAKNSFDSSLIKPPNILEKEVISAKSLDSITNKLNLNNIKLLKVEAEGAEPEVLKGAQKILSHTKYVSIDAGPERGIAQDDTVKECIDLMYAIGFKIIEFQRSRYVLLFKNSNFDN